MEGLSENRWALLSNVHHCMVDGVSATDLMSVMFEDSAAPASDERWNPAPDERRRARPTDPYDGGLYFGVTGDYDSSSDIDTLTAGVKRSIGELLEPAEASPMPTP